MLVWLDPVSQAIVDVICMDGYAVDVTQEGETYRAIATHPDGQTYAAEGTDVYLAVCALPDRVGIDLEDG